MTEGFSIVVSMQTTITSWLLTNANQEISYTTAPTLMITRVSCSCGNGIIDQFEECDPPDGSCCLADCNINPLIQRQAVTCRPSAGSCDVIETCYGNGTCPPDSFFAVGTLCLVNTEGCGYNA